MKYSKNHKLIDKETPTGLLLFDTDSGRMLELNPTAKLLWQKSKSPFNLADLKEIINKHCNSVKNVDADLVEFIEMAKKHNMVIEVGKD